MPTLFLDTSALVKRYLLTEPGAVSVHALLSAPDVLVVIARVTPVEVAFAFSRRQREGKISPAQREALWNAFRMHLAADYDMIEPDEEVWRTAERLIIDHPLRAYDAIQLASALRAGVIAGGDPSGFRFCSADLRQAAAGEREGLTVELIA